VGTDRTENGFQLARLVTCTSPWTWTTEGAASATVLRYVWPTLPQVRVRACLKLEALAERREDGGGRLRAQPARQSRAAADQQAILDGPQVLGLHTRVLQFHC
jgi:hypothetical protein